MIKNIKETLYIAKLMDLEMYSLCNGFVSSAGLYICIAFIRNTVSRARKRTNRKGVRYGQIFE